MRASSIFREGKPFGCPPILLVFAILLSLMIIIRYGAIGWGDTITYIYAWDAFLSKGELDPSRTPVYPLLLGISKALIGISNYKMAVIVFQHVLSILSVQLFYRLLKVLFSNKTVSIWLSLSYLIISDITWNNLLLTESITCSCIIFALYYSVRLLTAPSLKGGMLLFVTLVVLVFLRPAQMYVLLVAAIIFVIVFLKKRSKGSVLGLSVCGVVCMIIGLYVIQFKSSFGYYGISNVGDINQYYILKDGGMITDFESDLYKYDYKGFHEIVNDTINEHKDWYIVKTFERFYQAKNDVLFTFANLPIASTVLLLFSPHVSSVYFLLLLFPILLWTDRNRSKEIFFILSFSYFFLLANVIMVVVGAPNDWGRLLYPSMPVILLMVGKLISLFIDGYNVDHNHHQL